MKYIDFVNKLYIRGLKYKKTDFTKNLNYTKAGFTENLFLHSVKNVKTVTSKRTSEAVFKGYNSVNPIANIANDIIGDLNEDEIKLFIKDYISSKPNERAKNEQTLCDNFRDVISDISRDNLYERITTFYIDEVLKPAANSAKKVGKKSVDVNTESRTIPIPEIGSVEVSVDNIRCNNKSSHRPDPNNEIELVEALADTLNKMLSISIEIAESKGRELENETNNDYQFLKSLENVLGIDPSSSIKNTFISNKIKDLENLYQNLFITYGESIRRLASITNDNDLNVICSSLDNIEISDFDSGIIGENKITLPKATNNKVLRLQNLLESFLINKTAN
jgi:hypothetical protein